MHLDPTAVRAGWRNAARAEEEVAEARSRIAEATGSGMADLATTLTDAGADLRGVLDVVSAVVAEHGTGVEQCIADFQATDGQSAGEFHGLAR